METASHTESVTHHGRRTAYRFADRFADRAADGSVVLAVHGSGADSRVWRAQLGRLSGDRPVAAVDLSGHGESTDVDARPGWSTLAAYSTDVSVVAEAVDADVLVGSSLGGAVVLHLLLERGLSSGGELSLDGVVLAGTGAKLAVLEDLLAWLADDFERAVEFLHGGDRLFHDPDPRLVEASKAAMRETGRAVTERDYRTSHRFDVRDRLGEVDVPALAVVGEHDQLTPPWYHEFLAEEMADCELAVVEEAAHLAMLEQPEAFNEVVEGFVEGL